VKNKNVKIRRNKFIINLEKNNYLLHEKSKTVKILQIKSLFLCNISADIHIPADADKFILYKQCKKLLNIYIFKTI